MVLGKRREIRLLLCLSLSPSFSLVAAFIGLSLILRLFISGSLIGAAAGSCVSPYITSHTHTHTHTHTYAYTHAGAAEWHGSVDVVAPVCREVSCMLIAGWLFEEDALLDGRWLCGVS